MHGVESMSLESHVRVGGFIQRGLGLTSVIDIGSIARRTGRLPPISKEPLQEALSNTVYSEPVLVHWRISKYDV